jgi:hypothetical protein
LIVNVAKIVRRKNGAAAQKPVNPTQPANEYPVIPTKSTRTSQKTGAKTASTISG